MPTPPPGSLQQAAIPPTSQRRPPQHGGPAPHVRAVSRAPVDSGSSFAAPMHTPLGLIAIVLLLDLVLAGTGAFLLAKGLSKPTKAATSDTPGPPQKSEAAPSPAAPAPTPTQSASPTTPTPQPPLPAEQQAAAPPATTEPAKPAPAKPEPAPASARRPNAPATTPAKSTKPSTEAEIATKVMGSRTAFGNCRDQAGEVHGNIDIAFRVLGDGAIGNVSVVEDTTGSATLAACLRDTIATWKVTPHNGAPLSFVRPFTYP